MNGGTIFVLILAAAFMVFALYLAHLSRVAKREQEEVKRNAPKPSDRSDDETPPLRRAG